MRKNYVKDAANRGSFVSICYYKFAPFLREINCDELLNVNEKLDEMEKGLNESPDIEDN